MSHRLLCTCLLLCIGHTAAAETANGTVFDDRNRNGIYDEGEAGVSGVAVSNGEEVVLTDDSVSGISVD